MNSSVQITPVRYIVISPCRDEGQYLDATIKSMAKQTMRPLQWIIVNDGSTDTTGKIIDRWASKESWIVPVHRIDRAQSKLHAIEDLPADKLRSDRGKRARAAKEIEAFYEGFEYITAQDWDFIVKLDGDLGFEIDYFEKCFLEFELDRNLGIGGGTICHLTNGNLVAEPNPKFHVRGATKIYRRACWNMIGGVLCAAGWDTLDEVKANMMGWNTRSFCQLQVIHYRFTGAANGAWQNAIKKGEWNYISGYHPLFMGLKCLRRLVRRPFIVDSAGLLCGFLSAFFHRLPQIEDKRLIRYVREQQLRRLSFRSTIWK
jgi:poly-beta-1,6-N-acetyl-D-glucosamine synthase